MSRRTLENWRRAEPKRRGRPPLPEQEQRAELALIAREMHRQGRGTGWRPVWEVLSGRARLSVVQRYVPKLKRKRAQHRRRVREARRLHIHVHHENALWSMDAAQMGRDREGVPFRNSSASRMVSDGGVRLGCRGRPRGGGKSLRPE